MYSIWLATQLLNIVKTSHLTLRENCVYLVRNFLENHLKHTKMKVIYNTIFKRTSTYAVGIVASVFFFERAFDVASETIFESYNKGKLWKDIKHKYE